MIVDLAELGAVTLVLLLASGLGGCGQGSLVVVEHRTLLQRTDLSETSYCYVSDCIELSFAGTALTLGLEDHC